jgi:hypothetical protein
MHVSSAGQDAERAGSAPAVSGDPEAASARRLGPVDVLLAGAVAVTAAATFLLAFQGRIYANDGADLANHFAMPLGDATARYHNVAFLPCAWGLDAVWPKSGDPLAALEGLCALAGALGCAATLVMLRALAVPRWRALFGTAMLAAMPAVAFFSTVIEVHTLHFAAGAVAGAVAALAPWRRPALATGLTAAALGVTFLTHLSAPAIGPAVLFIAVRARALAAARHGVAPFSWGGIAGVGVGLGLGLAVGLALNLGLRGEGYAPDVGSVGRMVRVWKQGFHVDILWTDGLRAIGWLVPVALLGLLRAPWSERLAFLATYVPLCAFVWWWSIAEYGGYLLGPAFVLALAAARAPLAPPIGIVLVVLQVVSAAWLIVAHEREGHRLEDRVAAIRAVTGDDAAWVLSASERAPKVTIWLPNVHELVILEHIRPVGPVEDSFDGWIEHLPAAVAQVPVLVDTTFLEEMTGSPIRPHLEFFVRYVREHFAVEELAAQEGADWPMWRLRPRD